MTDELDWARHTLPVATIEEAKIGPSTALRVVGWTIVYLTFAPPIAVLLWRLATAPWPW